MKAKHTPGPWQSKMNIASAAIYCPLGGLIARLPVEHEGSRNGAAHNARLIAAAPELLEALQAVLRSFPTDRDMRDAGWERAEIDLACRDYEAARAAISKALPNAAAKEAGK